MLLGAWLGGCRVRPEERAGGVAPPPAAALAAGADTIPIRAQLAELDSVTVRAQRSGDEAERGDLILRAEALTDRLLESQLPFAWSAGSYSIESQLRQLQALADRIVAEVRRGERGAAVDADLRLFQQRIMALQADLRRPGRAAPPSVDSLLAAYAHGEVARGAPTGEADDDARGGARAGEPPTPVGH